MFDPEYVLARRVLLDGLQALGPHRRAVVLVGAQAVYLHTGEGDFAVAPFTTDVDLVLDPARLGADPRLAAALESGGFTSGQQPGTWLSKEGVELDLIVPSAAAPAGRRGARLGPHGNSVARKSVGLEAALVDFAPRMITSMDVESDPRQFEIGVGGPTALLVSKLHKIADRVRQSARSNDKDALDVLRLLQATPTVILVHTLESLRSDAMAGTVVVRAVALLRELFATSDAQGSMMAGRAVEELEDPATIRTSCAALANLVLRAVA